MCFLLEAVKMTKYKLNDERRSQSEVTLTGYMAEATGPTENNRAPPYEMHGYSNPALDSSDVPNGFVNGNAVNGNSDRLGVNNCTCNDKSK